MYSVRFRELMTAGYALANKLYFSQFDPHEFDQWIEDCRRFLSRCEPEPEGFPWCPDPRHIEEIVMLLATTRSRISRGEIQYLGVL